MESFILSTRRDTATSWSFPFTSIWVQFQFLHCTWVPTMETRLLWYTLLLVLLSSHLLELYSFTQSKVWSISTLHLALGSGFVVIYYHLNNYRMLELDQRSHCFRFLMVNSVTKMKWHSHCHRLYIMPNTVSLCLSMKMINDLSVNNLLVYIRSELRRCHLHAMIMIHGLFATMMFIFSNCIIVTWMNVLFDDMISVNLLISCAIGKLPLLQTLFLFFKHHLKLLLEASMLHVI